MPASPIHTIIKNVSEHFNRENSYENRYEITQKRGRKLWTQDS